MIIATKGGIMASIVIDSRAWLLVDFPWPRAMAFSIDALGNPNFFADTTSAAKRGFDAKSGPKTVCSLAIWVEWASPTDKRA